MVAPLFQFTFLCVVSLGNLCLGFAVASRLGLGPSLGALFHLEAATPALPIAAEEKSLNEMRPVSDAFNPADDTAAEVVGAADGESSEPEAELESELSSVTSDVA